MRAHRGRGGGCARVLPVYNPVPPKTTKNTLRAYHTLLWPGRDGVAPPGAGAGWLGPGGGCFPARAGARILRQGHRHSLQQNSTTSPAGRRSHGHPLAASPVMAIPSRRRRSWPSPPTTHAGMVIPSQRRRSPALISEVAFTTRYRGGTPRQRGAVRKASSTAQPRRGRVGGRRLRCGPRLWPRREWAARGPLVGPLEPGARSHRGGGGGCALALAVYEPPPRTHRTQNLLNLY